MKTFEAFYNDLQQLPANITEALTKQSDRWQSHCPLQVAPAGTLAVDHNSAVEGSQLEEHLAEDIPVQGTVAAEGNLRDHTRVNKQNRSKQQLWRG